MFERKSFDSNKEKSNEKIKEASKLAYSFFTSGEFQKQYPADANKGSLGSLTLVRGEGKNNDHLYFQIMGQGMSYAYMGTKQSDVKSLIDNLIEASKLKNEIKLSPTAMGEYIVAGHPTSDDSRFIIAKTVEEAKKLILEPLQDKIKEYEKSLDNIGAKDI